MPLNNNKSMWMDPPKSKYAIIEKKCCICNDIENDIEKNPILQISCTECKKYFLSHDKCSYEKTREIFWKHLKNEECFNLSGQKDIFLIELNGQNVENGLTTIDVTNDRTPQYTCLDRCLEYIRKKKEESPIFIICIYIFYICFYFFVMPVALYCIILIVSLLEPIISVLIMLIFILIMIF